MDIQYRRGRDRRFMVLRGVEGNSSYESIMMEKNEIKALIPFYIVEDDGNIQYWYDITGKKSIKDYLEQEGIRKEKLREIFKYMAAAMEEIENYLIAENHVMMYPDTTFLEKEKEGGLSFCYFPFPDEENLNPFIPFAEYLIENVNHDNEEIRNMCYWFYRIVSESGFIIGELMRRLEGDMDMEICQQSDDDVSFRIREMHEPEKIPVQPIEKDAEEKPVPERSLKKRIQKIIRDKYEELWKKLTDLFPVLAANGKKPASCSKTAVQSGRLIYEGDGKEEDFIVDKDVFRIGRDAAKADGVLHSGLISKRHASIERKNGSFYVKDLNSRKGTFINGRRLEKGEMVRLNDMDQIAFADVPYRWA